MTESVFALELGGINFFFLPPATAEPPPGITGWFCTRGHELLVLDRVNIGALESVPVKLKMEWKLIASKYFLLVSIASHCDIIGHSTTVPDRLNILLFSAQEFHPCIICIIHA